MIETNNVQRQGAPSSHVDSLSLDTNMSPKRLNVMDFRPDNAALEFALDLLHMLRLLQVVPVLSARESRSKKKA
jgi:hypothetical protein